MSGIAELGNCSQGEESCWPHLSHSTRSQETCFSPSFHAKENVLMTDIFSELPATDLLPLLLRPGCPGPSSGPFVRKGMGTQQQQPTEGSHSEGYHRLLIHGLGAGQEEPRAREGASRRRGCHLNLSTFFDSTAAHQFSRANVTYRWGPPASTWTMAHL